MQLIDNQTLQLFRPPNLFKFSKNKGVPRLVGAGSRALLIRLQALRALAGIRDARSRSAP